MGSNTVLLEILKFLTTKEAYNIGLITETKYKKYLNDIAQSLQKISDKREENEEDDGK